MTDPRRLVSDGYDTIAERYAAWQDTTGLKQRYIEEVRARVAPGGRVLDLGCGTGEHVTRHLAETYDTIGVDLSARSVALGAATVAGSSFVRADMAQLPFGDGSFDAIVAFFSLIHVPRDEQAATLARWHELLRPGGVLVVTMGTNGGGDTVGDFLGTEMFWSTYDEATNRALVREAGFEPEIEQIETEMENGEPVSFLWIVAHAR